MSRRKRAFAQLIVCAACRASKPTSEFSKNQRGRDRRDGSGRCTQCVTERVHIQQEELDVDAHTRDAASPKLVVGDNTKRFLLNTLRPIISHNQRNIAGHDALLRERAAAPAVRTRRAAPNVAFIRDAKAVERVELRANAAVRKFLERKLKTLRLDGSAPSASLIEQMRSIGGFDEVLAELRLNETETERETARERETAAAEVKETIHATVAHSANAGAAEAAVEKADDDVVAMLDSDFTHGDDAASDATVAAAAAVEGKGSAAAATATSAGGGVAASASAATAVPPAQKKRRKTLKSVSLAVIAATRLRRDLARGVAAVMRSFAMLRVDSSSSSSSTCSAASAANFCGAKAPVALVRAASHEIGATLAISDAEITALYARPHGSETTEDSTPESSMSSSSATSTSSSVADEAWFGDLRDMVMLNLSEAEVACCRAAFERIAIIRKGNAAMAVAMMTATSSISVEPHLIETIVSRAPTAAEVTELATLLGSLSVSEEAASTLPLARELTQAVCKDEEGAASVERLVRIFEQSLRVGKVTS